MEIRSSWFAIILLLLLSCQSQKPTPTEILRETQRLYESHNSISYDVDYRMKYFSDDEDTVKITGSCVLIREDSDTIFGGRIWMDTKDSIEKYYDLDHIYSFFFRQQKVMTYQAHADQDWAITGNPAGDIIRIGFFDPGKPLETARDTSNTILLGDTSLGSGDYWKIKIRYPDNPPISETEKTYFVHKKDLTIHKITFSARFQNEYQYNEWNLSNIRFDEYVAEDLQSRFESKIQGMTVEQYAEPSEEETHPLPEGSIAPKFTGILYPDSLPVNLTEYRGKLVLLDFWYMSCYPCIQAIPHIRKIHHEYKDRGVVVLGLNPFDNDKKGLKKLPEFIEYNALTYPVVFVDRDVPKLFNIRGYPTFYLISKQGTVLYSKVGYGEGLGDTLDSLIMANLN